MTKTIVALYDHRSEAETASRDLQAAGFETSAVEILSHADLTSGGWSGSDTTGLGTTTGDSSLGAAGGMARTDLSTGYVASPNTIPGSSMGTGLGAGAGMGAGMGAGTGATTGTTAGGILTRLSGWGIPNQDAQVYAEGVRRGGSLLKLRLDEDDVDRAMEVLERGNVVDVEERGTAYRDSGWTGFDESADYYDDSSADEERLRYSPGRTAIDTTGTGIGASTSGAGLTGAAAAMRDVNADATRTTRTGTSEREEQIPVVEEQVNIGKRSVERGGVRVRSYVVETPVEEQVRLRDETVTVERRPGGLVEGSADVPADAFRERTIEVTETDEEAVVSKTAHVRETVVVRKDVEERAQSVRDTVRRTEVEIEDTRDKSTRNALSDRPLSDRTDDDVTR
ncbi:MAG: YsnF/AvaK domain-containing protein [Alphaproteobacteria bacterium]